MYKITVLSEFANFIFIVFDLLHIPSLIFFDGNIGESFAPLVHY